MTLTKNQRNTAIGVAILATFYYGPTAILSVRQFIINREYAAQKAAQPEVVRAPPKSEAPKQVDVDAAPFPFSAVTGFWTGSGTTPGHLCSMHLELRENPQAPSHMIGFPSMTCMPYGLPAMKTQPYDPSMGKLNPSTAIGDGTWDKQTTAIRFTIAKALSSDNCPLTDLSVTPFGTTSLTAEWKEGTCQSGNIVMQRTNR